MEDFEFYSPSTLNELCKLLKTPGGRIISGGTDTIPKLRAEKIHVPALMDISKIKELRFICEKDEWIEIGARTTYADVLDSPVLEKYAPSLIRATKRVASPMARQRGTIGGNIANASPAADSVPPLLTLDAVVHLMSLDGEREIALEEVMLGPEKNCLKPDEFIHHIAFKKPSSTLGFGFEKLGPRQGMTISIVNAAAAVGLDTEGRINAARIAVGAVAPTPVRCRNSEESLIGQIPDEVLWEKASKVILDKISPIDDVRASKEYRLKAAVTLVHRALRFAYEMAKRNS